jgi:hypothetical protein
MRTTVTRFSMSQTVVSQEIVVSHGTNRIRYKHIRLTGIIRYDVPDFLFFTRFLRLRGLCLVSCQSIHWTISDAAVIGTNRRRTTTTDAESYPLVIRELDFSGTVHRDGKAGRKLLQPSAGWQNGAGMKAPAAGDRTGITPHLTV